MGWMSISFPIPNRCQDTDSPTHISGSGKFPKRNPLRAKNRNTLVGDDSPTEVNGTKTLVILENQNRSLVIMFFGDILALKK
jgi:hypothetical protein